MNAKNGRFKAIIFDLDGTLLDTLADIAGSMNAVLNSFGFPTHPVDSYRYFTGKGIDGLVRQVLPAGRRDDLTVNEFVSAAKEQYRHRWADSTRPYPGVHELLDALETMGLPKAVLSNKADEFTKLMVASMLPSWSFCDVRGEGPLTPKKPDPSAALEIARLMDLVPGQILYLGDSDTDMQTAGAAGMYAVGALWGFRDAKELLANGAKALVKTPMEILDLLD